jgi:hypothetical protein
MPVHGAKKGERRGGRKKGAKNKTTVGLINLKDAVIESFGKVGGVDYLVKLAKDDQKAYSSLLGRIIPSHLIARIEITMRDSLVKSIKERSGTIKP